MEINNNLTDSCRKWLSLTDFSHWVTVTFMLLLSAIINVAPAMAQPKTYAEKADSLLALLPQKQGAEKLRALADLSNLTYGAEKKRYLYMQIDEARKQKNVEEEGKALMILTLQYFPQFDTDSLFVIGEEAVRFNRQHKLYGNMFFVKNEFIRRHRAQGRFITALRQAEEVYAEVKELGEPMHLARILSSMGDILDDMQQYDEAERYYLESIEAARPFRQEKTLELFTLVRYLRLINMYIRRDRPQDALRYTDFMQEEIERLQRELPGFNFEEYRFDMDYNRVLAYAGLNLPDSMMAAMRRAEAVFKPEWIDDSPGYSVSYDNMYAVYYRATGNYDKALELWRGIVRFTEEHGRNSLGMKTLIAQTLSEKSDFKAATELYGEILKKREELNTERFQAQINELRTIYELDKAEMEAQRRQAALRQMRLIAAGLTFACIAMALIAGLTVWSRRRIAAKNRGLYRQVRAQDLLEEALETEREKNRKMHRLLQDEASGTAEENDDDKFFKKLTVLMNEKKIYTDAELNRQELAAKIGMNERRLHDCIKNNTGMGFNDYINSLRIAHSRVLLSRLDENLTIEAIALDSGFKSRYTFHRVFREKYELSPQEFRRLLQKIP